MDWLADDRRAPRRSARAVAGGALRHHARHELRARRTIRSRSCKQRERGAISVYAKGDDYHEIIKPRLKALARWLIAQAGGDVKVFVDTAAVMEKPLAAAPASAGRASTPIWCRANSARGCFSARSSRRSICRPTTPDDDHCGTCRACLDVCPTAAFPAPYRLDARRCISYLTIEHKGPIPRELRPLMGNRIYGCDDCLAVCPWNKFAQAGPRGEARGARRRCARRSSPNWRGSTTPHSARCSPRPR